MDTGGRIGRLAGAVVGGFLVAAGLAVGPAAPAAAQVQNVPTDAGFGPPLQTPELISNGSFAEGFAQWAATPGENVAVYSGSAAGEGSSYLETNTGSAGSVGSVWQDVSTPVQAGQSYTASALLRSPAAVPVSVDLVLWALGGPAPVQVGETALTVSSSSWTRAYTDVDVSNGGYGMLRLQLYLTTPGDNLDLDGASLQDAGVGDAGFAQGMGPWQTSPGANRAIYSSPTAPDGQDYLETNSGSGSVSSVYQDLWVSPLYDHTYDASVYLRSPSGTPVSVVLALWALGGPASADLGQTQLTVTSAPWTLAYTDVDVQHFGHNDLRFQIYALTPGVNLDVGAATLQDSRVVDSGFDQSGLGPWTWSPGANALAHSGTTAVSGDNWLETNTGSGSSSSIYQDIDTTPVPGYAYQASLLMRSTTGGPIAATVVLWALGGSAPTEMSQTSVTVSSAWAQYSTELDVADSGHTLLRLQVFLETAGQTLAIGAVTLPDQTVGPALTPLRQNIVAIAEGQDQYQAGGAAVPTGSDCNVYTAFFGRGSTVGNGGVTCSPGTLSEEWCSDFADWVWVAAGLDPDVTGWAFDWVTWGEATGSFKPGAVDDPEPGDAVVWGSLSSQYGQHVGIVAGVADGMINIVSGNADNETVQESGYFDPTTSTINGYPIVGYTAPDGFGGT